MKKIYLFLMLFAATALNAQVAFLKVSDTYPDYGGEQPEQQAYNWFISTYGAGNVVDMNNIPTDASTYKVLWVNVERDLSEGDFDNLFPVEKRTALSNYVKAGGNLLLTKKASRLACHIGRMGDRGGSKYYPSWNSSGYKDGNDVWTINAMIGVGHTLRDARQHPIFKDMTKGQYNNYTHESFPLIGKVKRSDDNCIWTEMETKAGGDTPNDNISTLNNFQSEWNCQVLAVWGQVRNYCAPVIVEFFPQNEYKGTVLSIGSNAYQWGTSNDYISNVQKLTQNALTYLSQGGVEYGYYMPYALSELYSTDDYHADFQTAKWFYDNYVVTNKGRFIHKEEDFPSDMKVLWVHNDRVGVAKEDFYNAFGGDAFKNKLNTFLSTNGGGNLYLSKQACYLAYKLQMIYEPNVWGNEGYEDPNGDEWSVNAGNLGYSLDASCHQDRSFHPIYRGLTKGTYHYDKGSKEMPFETFMLVGLTRRTDHNTIWSEMTRRDGTTQGNTEPNKLANFESDWNCKVLGVWGQVMDFSGAGLIEFNPASRGGKIIANGFAAYQWGTSNTDPTAIGNVHQLTANILEYLKRENEVKDCPNCFPIY